MNKLGLAFLMSLSFANTVHAAIPLVEGAQCSVIFSAPQKVVTDGARLTRMRETESWQISMIDGSMLGHSDTPPFFFEASSDQQAVYALRSNGLHGQFSFINVSGLGSTGLLRGTLELPVSGHTGYENALAWAKTDTFDIYMQVGEGVNGDQFGDYGAKLIPVVQGARSTALVTRQDIEIPMIKGKQVRLLYYRSGSGGPYGYPEGRVMTFAWDGQ